MLDITTLIALEPHIGKTFRYGGVEMEEWNGPWNCILTSLFTLDERYAVAPHRSSSFTFEIAKRPTSAVIFNTVLMVEIGDRHHWETGKDVILETEEPDTAFLGTAGEKIYWIRAIGTHWRYGEWDAGQDPRPLIPWHDTFVDNASYHDFMQLKALVDNL